MVNTKEYFSSFGEVLLYIVGAVLFISATLLISRLVRPDRPNPEKMATYESGEQAVGGPWAQFNMRFYVIAIMFLLFEVEIVFLFPWSIVFGNKEINAETHGLWGWFSLVEMLIFIAILALGLAFAWVNGYLDWVKSVQKPTDFKPHVPKELYDKINDKYK